MSALEAERTSRGRSRVGHYSRWMKKFCVAHRLLQRCNRCMRNKLSSSVEQKLRGLFPAEHWDQVREVLARYGQKEWQLEVERVHFAVLWLSEGKLSELNHYMQLALRDYREVLSWAERPHPVDSREEKKVDHAKTYIRWQDK